MAKNTTTAVESDVAVAEAPAANLPVEHPENNVVAQAIDFYADSGLGLENVDAQSVAIPFITVLQGLSPQIETVEGAKPGLIINTVLQGWRLQRRDVGRRVRARQSVRRHQDRAVRKG